MRTILRMGLVAAVAAAAVSVVQPQAVAAPAGSASERATSQQDFPYTGTATDYTLEDGSTNLVACDTNTIQGLATDGSFGLELLNVDGPSSSWSGCTGLFFNFEITAIGTWLFNATGQSGSATIYRLTGVDLHVGSADGTSCVFDITGSVNATYDASTQQLRINPDTTLATSNVTGCLGLINEGDAAQYSATYAINTVS